MLHLIWILISGIIRLAVITWAGMTLVSVGNSAVDDIRAKLTPTQQASISRLGSIVQTRLAGPSPSTLRQMVDSLQRGFQSAIVNAGQNTSDTDPFAGPAPSYAQSAYNSGSVSLPPIKVGSISRRSYFAENAQAYANNGSYRF